MLSFQDEKNIFWSKLKGRRMDDFTQICRYSKTLKLSCIECGGCNGVSDAKNLLDLIPIGPMNNEANQALNAHLTKHHGHFYKFKSGAVDLVFDGVCAKCKRIN